MRRMEQLSRDVRIAIRSLLRQPGTAALAAVALAFGIGLTTTMFCIVDGVFLRGLPFERADRLLYVGEQDARLADRRPRDIPLNDYLEWRAAQRSFEGLAAFTDEGADVAADGVTPQHYAAARISANAFALLRIAPAMGRVLTDADAADGAPPVALISETAWRRQFDADPAILGRVVRVDRVPTTIVGVMPAGFGFPHD
jgi:putative ABC transport system permease protein